MRQGWRAVWRCASTIPGAQCVMTSGTSEMQRWSAGNSIYQLPVGASTLVAGLLRFDGNYYKANNLTFVRMYTIIAQNLLCMHAEFLIPCHL